MKVNIISIGIGPRLNRAELEMMASDPKDSHLFFVGNAGELKNLLRSLVKTSCQGKNQVLINLEGFRGVIALLKRGIVGKYFITNNFIGEFWLFLVCENLTKSRMM